MLVANWRNNAAFLIGFDIGFAIENPAIEFQVLGSDAFRSPTFEGGFADAPARGEFLLV